MSTNSIKWALNLTKTKKHLAFRDYFLIKDKALKRIDPFFLYKFISNARPIAESTPELTIMTKDKS
mgnify:CR=1 FL=1